MFATHLAGHHGSGGRVYQHCREHGERRVFQLCEQSADNVLSESILASPRGGEGKGLFKKEARPSVARFVPEMPGHECW